MNSIDDFGMFDYLSQSEQECNDAVETFITNNNRRTKIRHKDIETEAITIKGKKVYGIIDSIMNGKFKDNRNPIDFRGRYITETLPDGKTRSVRNWDIEFSRKNYPVVSGVVEVNDSNLQYIYIGTSCVWAFLSNGKRYIFHTIDSQPYNLSPSQKEGDGKCKFGAYNGRRYHKDLIMALDLYVWKSHWSSESFYPDDYKF